MLQVARLAPKVLEDSTPLVIDFFDSQRHAQGGFCNRDGDSDLYYTVFGIEGYQALQQPIPNDWLHSYVRSFGNGEELDLVHLSCLARCWSALPPLQRGDCPSDAIIAKVLQHRTPDGGYDTAPGSDEGNLYSCFLAVGAYQDLGIPLPHVESLVDFIADLRDPKGGYFNTKDLGISLVPQTAAAVNLLRQLGFRQDDSQTADWILSCFHPQGGFRAGEIVLLPDLLSTATALHALASMKVDLGEASELCLDFIDTLWTNRGGFYGQWEDTHVDVEYTYYALLALGHLSLLTP